MPKKTIKKKRFSEGQPGGFGGALPPNKRRKKLLYKLIHKQEVSRTFLFDELNEHGAFNDVYKKVTIYNLQFEYNPPVVRSQVPEVIGVQYLYTTSNKEVANKYSVGEEYGELPK